MRAASQYIWPKVERPLNFTNQIAITENSASRLFTLEAKVQRPLLSKMPSWQSFLTKATDSQMKFGLDMNGNPNYGQEAVSFLFI
jgi:hypothetical protein